MLAVLWNEKWLQPVERWSTIGTYGKEEARDGHCGEDEDVRL